jgi:alkylation response protein AidB-like acyl-CoA dehydrogenase
MDFVLSAQQQALRNRIIHFCRAALNDGVIDRDRHGVFAHELWRQCAAVGLLGLLAPREYGGLGLDAVSTVAALDAFGYGCLDAGLTFAVGAHLLTAVVPIMQYGTAAQQRRYLPGLCDGSLIGINAMTEPETGSDAFALATTAVPDGDGYCLNGSKRLISNIPAADVIIIYALTDAAKGYYGGTTAFLLEKGTAGYTPAPAYETMGLRTSQLGELQLTNVHVNHEAILGGLGGGAQVFTSTMDWERACLPALHVGSMERLIEQSIAYARSRQQFGQSIGKFQAVSHKIAEMKVRLDAARLLTYKAASGLGQSRAVALEASIAKVFVTEAYVQTALDTVQIHGGMGYLTANHVERAVRDAVASTLYSGTSEMQKNIIARWMGL